MSDSSTKLLSVRAVRSVTGTGMTVMVEATIAFEYTTESTQSRSGRSQPVHIFTYGKSEHCGAMSHASLKYQSGKQERSSCEHVKSVILQGKPENRAHGSIPQSGTESVSRRCHMALEQASWWAPWSTQYLDLRVA